MTGHSERPLGMVGRGALVLGSVMWTILAAADPFTLVFFLSYAAVGVVLAVRRPRNSVGWLLLVVSAGSVATTARPGIDGAALQAGTASWPDFLNAWTGSWGGSAGYVAMLALTLVFPSGRLPTGRWRGAAMALLATAVVAVVLTAAAPAVSFNIDGGPTSISIPNRFAVIPDLPLWALVPTDGSLAIVVLVLVAIGLVSMIVRYRRSSGIVRLQLRWLVASLSFSVVALLGAFAALVVAAEQLGGLVWIPAIIAYPTIPIAIGVSITRYRLFEIDRIISRTIAWPVVSGLILGIFALGLVALQGLLAGITQGQTLAVAVSTLVAFAVFQPMRRRVQAVVDRRFDRARYDAERTVDVFGRRLRDETDIRRVTTDLSGTARSAVAPAYSAIWLRENRR